MAEFDIVTGGVHDLRRLGRWAADEGWNPGALDSQAFFPADPYGFLFGRLDGEPVVSISAVRYGSGFGFLGFYIALPEVRGQGYGIRVWRAGMARLAGRNIGLDGVVDQQENYRRSGFRRAWNHLRYEGVPAAAEVPPDVALVDARALPFDRIAAYDRRFFPTPRDAFLATWLSLPDRTALAAVRDGELHGLGVLRPSFGSARVGPLYASSPQIAAALLDALATSAAGAPVAVDVPDVNGPAVRLVEQLGLSPSFEAARMYTGPDPDMDLAGIFGITSLELG
ncbi:GNAT family N-acetyltransferase [Streptomyces sp. B1866]|uniref:GNAT family N-acetyltransferase n=1 Tax=Streptomyces sp. B1866 TaxID=3075431 RepID=UPI00288FC893|nr:GNAT family N-acetyltransferase [Streptomyces sp. B1866]MDT3397599.1 GNAT family N-acetyltransferase [Streptomyces sp. B1866]